MMPFVFEDASRPESDYKREDATFSRVELNTRLQARAFDLRVRLLLATPDDWDLSSTVLICSWS